MSRAPPLLLVAVVVLGAHACHRASCPPCVSVAPAPVAAPGPEPIVWERLFDGESLRGWTTTGGRYDGHARWSVQEGAIVGEEGENHAGGLLYTEAVYEDVEVELEAKLTWPFDSGVFLRMRPDAKGAQVTLDARPGGEIAGIYADGWWLHVPYGEAHWRRDDWNRVRVRCTGDPMHVVAWVNGERVTDYRFPAAAEGFAREGRIGLQVHGARDDPPGSRAMFRALRARRLPREEGRLFERDEAGAERLTPAGERAGWRALFDGRSLDGWSPAGGSGGYRVRDGLLELLAEGDSPHLRTDAEYRDFHLRLEFRIAHLANSGVFLRADPAGGNPAFSGCEVQILDDHHWEAETKTTLKPWQFTGSLYGAVAPARRVLRPVGEWNALEVIVRGPYVTTALNGVVLYDVDTTALEVDPPFTARAAQGFIGLQRHAPGRHAADDVQVAFRNLFLRELDASAAGR